MSNPTYRGSSTDPTGTIDLGIFGAGGGGEVEMFISSNAFEVYQEANIGTTYSPLNVGQMTVGDVAGVSVDPILMYGLCISRNPVDSVIKEISIPENLCKLAMTISMFYTYDGRYSQDTGY
jgi:hypothetical protein